MRSLGPSCGMDEALGTSGSSELSDSSGASELDGASGSSGSSGSPESSGPRESVAAFLMFLSILPDLTTTIFKSMEGGWIHHKGTIAVAT